MKIILIFFFLIFIIAFDLASVSSQPLSDNRDARAVLVIEDFEDGTIELYSYPGEDNDPFDWTLSTDNTFGNSNYSLQLSGNTWKLAPITPVQVDSNTVWQVASFTEDESEIHGFGLSDGDNVLFYSFSGSEMLDIEEWIPVYQGNFPDDQWNIFQLPIADDWFAWYEYMPEITSVIFINDQDEGTPGIVYFDNIWDVTERFTQPPQPVIEHTVITNVPVLTGGRNIGVRFDCRILNPLPDEYTYHWHFGDGESSWEESPVHDYQIADDHEYTVTVEVFDEKGSRGYASKQIILETGTTTFPATINFVGDIMLARGYEENGGIIQTQGVEAIFLPTLTLLGEAADITVANLECPLTTYGIHHPTKSIYFKGDPENVDGLTFAGIDIVTLANNHTLDYMYPGLLQTQQVLAANSILFSGAGVNSYEAYQPLFRSIAGLSLAFLASSDRTGQYNNYQPYLQAGFNKPGFAYMTPYYISQQINEVRDIVDLVVIEMHAGSEYSLDPGSNYDMIEPDDMYPDEEYSPLADIPHMWDIAIRHHAIDSGADLVIVHHPHIIQGLEIYNGKLIAHSLGNFVFDLNYAETMPSMILNTKFDDSGFYEFTVTPVFIDDWIPQEAMGELGLHILDYVARRSRELDTYLFVDRESVRASVITDTLSMPVITESFTSSAAVESVGGYTVSDPVRLERFGNISQINNVQPIANWEFRLGRETIWFGNFEDEGSTLWDVNSSHEWYDNTVSYEGERSLCHRRYYYSGDNIITNLEQRIRKYGGLYSLHGYIMTQNAANVTLEARYYNTRTTSYILGTEDIGTWIDGDTEWTYYHKELTIPGNAYFFDIRLNSDCPDADVGYSWFDNVGLIEWSDWQNYYQDIEIENPNDYYYIQFRTNSSPGSVQLTYSETNYGGAPYRRGSDWEFSPGISAVIKALYPNPFNPDINIEYNLKTATRIQLKVYNIKGQLVRVLVNETQPAGDHLASWNGIDINNTRVGSGIYFIRIESRGHTQTKKCILIK